MKKKKKKEGKLLIVHIHSILMNQTLKSPATAKKITPSQFSHIHFNGPQQ